MVYARNKPSIYDEYNKPRCHKWDSWKKGPIYSVLQDASHSREEQILTAQYILRRYEEKGFIVRDENGRWR